MSLSDVTITVSAVDYVYTPTYVAGSQAIRSLVGSTFSEPETLEVSNTPGSKSKPFRLLVKLSTTKATEGDVVTIGTGQFHCVFTVPTDGTIAIADIQLLVQKMQAYLTDDKVAQLLAGSLG